MPSESEKAEAKAAREAAWWDRWWAADYSWEGLAKLDAKGEPEKPWVGWSVTQNDELIETTNAPVVARAASLQDYFRWDPTKQRFRTPAELRSANLLCKSKDQPTFHIFHLPQRYQGSEQTWKHELEADKWAALEKELALLLSHGAGSVPQDHPDHSPADRRTQLQGAILRTFPRPSSARLHHESESEASHPAALHLVANHAAFLSDCDASKLEFGSQTDFKDACFFAAVDFREAQFFGGGASFWAAQFLGGIVDFVRARFSGGDTYFTNALFFGESTKFDGADFSGGSADFLNAEFAGEETSFANTIFSSGNVSFRNAHIACDHIDFHDAIFSGGSVSFRDAHIACDQIDFQCAIFSGGSVDFSYAQFLGEAADFSNAQFGKEGSSAAVSFAFDEARFRHRFAAVQTQFFGPTSFRGAQFEGAALFGDAQQSGELSEPVQLGAHFHDATSFRGATFKSLADFARCQFPDRAENRNAAFEGARFFESVDFKGVERLPLSAFQGALLDKGILIGPEHPNCSRHFEDALNDARLAAERDELTKSESAYDPRNDADFENRFTDARLAALEGGCRVLKHAMAQVSDRQREQAFFNMEMRARSRRPSTSWTIRFLTGAYGRFSDYGGAVFLPMLTSTVLAAMFSLGFFVVTIAFGSTSTPELIDGLAVEFSSVAEARPAQWNGVPAPEAKPITRLLIDTNLPVHQAFSNSIHLAARNMLGPLGHLFPGETPFAYAGNGGRFWFNAVLGLLSFFQTIPSLILLFLAGLALRRKFQIS